MPSLRRIAFEDFGEYLGRRDIHRMFGDRQCWLVQKISKGKGEKWKLQQTTLFWLLGFHKQITFSKNS